MPLYTCVSHLAGGDVFDNVMFATNYLEKPTALSVFPSPPWAAEMNTSSTEPEPFIGLDPYRNDSELFTKCEDQRWRHSADMMVGVFYLVISIVGISENLYVFYQMVQTVKFRINQVTTCLLVN